MPLRKCETEVACYVRGCHRECLESTLSPTHAALIDTSAAMLQQAVGVLSTPRSRYTLRSVQPYRVHDEAVGISKHLRSGMFTPLKILAH